MPRRGTEKENFQINKKEATVAEEFFSKSTSHWRPLFWYNARFSARKDPQLALSVSVSQRQSLAKK